MAGKDTRGERLAAALRDNLRRRKAQAREVAAPPAEKPGDQRWITIDPTE